MANSNLIVSFLTVVLLTVVSHAASTDVVSTVCPKTTNPTFCASVLRSAGTTDLKRLAVYTLKLAHKNATTCVAQAKSLVSFITNPPLKQRYSSCVKSFDEAVGDIETAQKDLRVGDFNAVNIATSGAMTAIDDCQDNFKQPPADRSMLLINGKTLKDICSIILVISNLL